MTDSERELSMGYVYLREYFEMMFREREKQLDFRFKAAHDALKTASAELERRLEGLNQLRSEVIKDRELFIKKDIYDTKTAFYDDWCRSVDKSLTKIETRSITWTAAIGIFFIIILQPSCTLSI